MVYKNLIPFRTVVKIFLIIKKFKIMFAKNNLTGPGVKKNKIAKNQENFSIFNVDVHKSFPKFCKQNYENKFKS